MTSKKTHPPPQPSWEPQSIGLAPERYAAALRYLFDRPVAAAGEEEWFWIDDEPFEATPLEWTRIQTVLFANAGAHLAGHGDEQVGMGLTYVMSNSVSHVSHAAIDPSVPLEEAMRMMAAMPALWRDCFGPRLASIHAPIGSSSGRLGYACYMWFDEWPTFRNARNVPAWRDAVWHVLEGMLAVPCRSVQIAALHGIGHLRPYLLRQPMIDQAIQAFLQKIGDGDEALTTYAKAARRGMVQ